MEKASSSAKVMVDKLHKGWFTEFSHDDLARLSEKGGKSMMRVNGEEVCGSWTGQAFSLEVEEVLFSAKSKFQDVLVFKRHLSLEII